MSELKNVSINSIDPNPFRNLSNYPWIERKLEQLQRSIEDVGLWEGIIVRQLGKRYQMAFGHHRLQAARNAGVKKAPVIVRKLTDEEMLRFMGRENGEDYSTEFLLMLNTWEGAVGFLSRRAANFQALDIAKVLGWVRRDTGKKAKQNSLRMTDVAVACDGAAKMIGGDYLSREDLEELSVRAANEIVTRASFKMEQLDRMAKTTNRPKESLEEAKGHIATGAKRTARKSRDGEVTLKGLKGSVEVESYIAANAVKEKTQPLFDAFGTKLADQIGKMLSTDSAAAKLSNMAEVIDHIVEFEDAQTLKRIEYELENIADRAAHWRKKLKPKTKSNVVRLHKLLEERT